MAYTLSANPTVGGFTFSGSETALSYPITHHRLKIRIRANSTGNYGAYIASGSRVSRGSTANISNTISNLSEGTTYQIQLVSERTENDPDFGDIVYNQTLGTTTVTTGSSFAPDNGIWGNPYLASRGSAFLNVNHRWYANSGHSAQYPTAAAAFITFQKRVAGSGSSWTGVQTTVNNPSNGNKTTAISIGSLSPNTTYETRTHLIVSDASGQADEYYSSVVNIATLAIPTVSGTPNISVGAHNGSSFPITISTSSAAASHSYQSHYVRLERKSGSSWVTVNNSGLYTGSSSTYNTSYSTPQTENAETVEFRAILFVRAEGYVLQSGTIKTANGTTSTLPARTITSTVAISTSSSYNGANNLGIGVTGNFSNMTINRGSINSYRMVIYYKRSSSTTWLFGDNQTVPGSFNGGNGGYSIFFAEPKNGESWDFYVRALVTDDLGKQYYGTIRYAYNIICNTPTPPSGNWRAIPINSSNSYWSRLVTYEGNWPASFTTEGDGDATGFLSKPSYIQRRIGTGNWVNVSSVGSPAPGASWYYQGNLDGYSTGTYQYRAQYNYTLLNNQTQYGSYREYSSVITVAHEGDDRTVSQTASATLNRKTANQQDTVSLNATLRKANTAGTHSSYTSTWRVYNASNNSLIATISSQNFTPETSYHNVVYTPTSGLNVYYRHTLTSYFTYYGRNSSATNTWQSANIATKVPVTYTATPTWGDILLANGKMTREVFLGAIQGSYQTLTNVDQILYWRPQTTGSYTVVDTRYSSTPGAMSGTSGTLVDTQTQYWYISTRVRGTYYGVAFDQTFSTPVSAIVYNAANTGTFVHNFYFSISPSSGPNTKVINGIPSITRNGGTGGLIGYTNNSRFIERRVTGGNTWNRLNTKAFTVNGANDTYYDPSGTIGTTYDYRVGATSTATTEVGDGQYNEYTFTTYGDHQTIEYQNVFSDLLISNYAVSVQGHFTLGHSYTQPSASNRQLKRYEWAPNGVNSWTAYTNVSTLPRATILQSRIIMGRTSGSDEQASNSSQFILSSPPAPVDNFTAIGSYAGNRLNWTSSELSARTEISRGGVVLFDLDPGTDTNIIDGSAVNSTNYNYTIRHYYSDAGFVLGSSIKSASATRTPTPALPAYPVNDSAAFIGKATDGSPIVHLAPTGTSLTNLKSPTPLASSYMHSSSPLVVVTDIKDVSSGNLDASTQALLASQAFMAVLVDYEGTTRSADMYMSKLTFSHYGTVSANNTFNSGIRFGSGNSTAYYTGASTIVLPDWAESIRFYFLNISNNGAYESPRDASTDIKISKNNLKVRGMGIDNAKVICGLGPQTDGTVVTALNYQDDILPFANSQVYANTYSGTTEEAIQVLGTAPSVGWEILPNKGRIDRVLGNGDKAPWWNAGYGKTRLSFVGSVNYDVAKTSTTAAIPAAVEQPSGLWEAEFSGSTNGIGSGGAEVLLALPDTHQAGDFYGIIVTPIGTDGFVEGIEEFYADGKGVVNWTSMSNSIRLLKYGRTKFLTYDLAPGEPEVQAFHSDHILSATRVANNIRLSFSWEGKLEGQNWGSSENLVAAPVRITIIQMR